MKYIKTFEDFINESADSNDSFEKWKKALQLYDTSDLNSIINRHEKGGKQPTSEQDRELSRIFKGSKLTSRFIMRSDFGRWKTNATKSNYDKDCKEFGQAKVDDLVDRVLSIYNIESIQINEAKVSKSVQKIMDSFIEFSADEAEELIMALSAYYSDNEDDLTNMNAKKISDHLFRAAEELRKRTGN